MNIENMNINNILKTLLNSKNSPLFLFLLFIGGCIYTFVTLYPTVATNQELIKSQKTMTRALNVFIKVYQEDALERQIQYEINTLRLNKTNILFEKLATKNNISFNKLDVDVSLNEKDLIRKKYKKMFEQSKLLKNLGINDDNIK